MAYSNKSVIDDLQFSPINEVRSEQPKDEFSKLLSEIEKEVLAQERSSDSGSQKFSISAILGPSVPITTSTSSNNTAKSTERNKRLKTSHGKSDSGLRRFSKELLGKVKQKGVTSFDEVADEMFRSKTNRSIDDSSECAKKNVRRRVYDILNVLVAMEIVSKDGKEITWVGLPSETPEELLQLQQEKRELEESIQQKTADLQQLILQQIAYKNLLQNKMKSSPRRSPATADSLVHLPFIAVCTNKSTVITHSTSQDKIEHVFNFDQPFQIYDNMEVLMRMGMAFGLEKNMCSEKNLEISRTLVSKEFEPYLEDMTNPGHQRLLKY